MSHGDRGLGHLHKVMSGILIGDLIYELFVAKNLLGRGTQNRDRPLIVCHIPTNFVT